VPQRSPPSPAPLEKPRRFDRLAAALRNLDSRPGLIKAAESMRGLLPGDRYYGDPLSVAGSEPTQLIGQRLAALTADRPSALREVGMSALQVWQALSEAQGRGRGDQELTILFTDLVDFSSWALAAGDAKAIDLLRAVGRALEPPIEEHGGQIVKRLGDGLMAVFEDPQDAVEAALEGCRALEGVEVDGHRPQLRAGVHLGKPRKLGGDYFGVDVNVTARVAAAASPDEVLVSDAVHQRLERGELKTRRRWRFKAKGAPADLKVYAVKAAGASAQSP
jgi:adenylate cyclase